MKIQGNRPEYDQSIAGRVDTSRAGEVGGTQGAAAPAAPTPGTDQVRVSSDAQLASAAIAAAEKAPDIRPEAGEVVMRLAKPPVERREAWRPIARTPPREERG